MMNVKKKFSENIIYTISYVTIYRIGLESIFFIYVLINF